MAMHEIHGAAWKQNMRMRSCALLNYGMISPSMRRRTECFKASDSCDGTPLWKEMCFTKHSTCLLHDVSIAYFKIK